MTRSLLAFLFVAIVMTVGMGIISSRLLTLERSEQIQALQAENERLSLWRLDSELLPLVLRESSRVYGDAISDAGSTGELQDTVQLWFWRDSFGGLTWYINSAYEPQAQSLVTNLHTDLLQQPEDQIALSPPNPAQQAAIVEPLTNSLQQVAKSRNEYRSRSGNSVLFNQRQQSFDTSLEQIPVEPMSAKWISEKLYLVRIGNGGDDPVVEGCLLDFPKLKSLLLNRIDDLLPNADLIPYQEPNAENHRSLANLPLLLIPGAPNAANLPVSSALKPTLLVAWSCLAISLIAFGCLLIGIIRLSERRAAFVSAVTHELRTPLTTFRLYCDLLAKRDQISNEKHDRYVETLKTEAGRLHYLIENVLSWARIERSADTNMITVIDWHRFFPRVELSIRERIAQAGMALELKTTDESNSLCFLANTTAVERILFNLIDNACKYAKNAADNRIHLEIAYDGKYFSLVVRDHGDGISPDMQRRLFKPFSKSAEQAARSAPGIGLGLCLSRRLARSMKGDLIFRGTDRNGTQFELRLPAENRHHDR